MTIICHITTVHNAKDSRIYYKECLSIDKKRYKVNLVAPIGETNFDQDVHYIPIRQRKNKIARRIISPFEAVFKAIKSRAEIIHFHDPEIIPAAIYAKLRGIKVVYDVHEYYSEIIPYNTKSKFLKKAIQSFFHFTIEKIPSLIFDRLVFPTISFADEFGNRSKNISIVNLPSKSIIDKVLIDKSAQKEYDVLFVGTISPFRMKIFVEIIDKVRIKLPSIKFLFLGISKETISWTQQNSHPDTLKRITFVERVPYELVNQYIQKCKIGLNYHPFDNRFNISIPMKVFEYMQYGLPSVTTALPEMKRYLTNNETAMLIETNEVSNFAIAIQKLLHDKEFYEKMSGKSSELIRTELYFEKSESKKLNAMYSELSK